MSFTNLSKRLPVAVPGALQDLIHLDLTRQHRNQKRVQNPLMGSHFHHKLRFSVIGRR